MSGRTRVTFPNLQRWLFLLLVASLTVTLVSVAWAGLIGRTSAVGGISISADGIVGPASVDVRNLVLNELRREVKTPTGALGSATSLRMISLKALDAACQEAMKAGTGSIPDEVRFLAGIQRIQYVFVYPEDNDIVLAGPGEGWKVDEYANVVGVTTDLPVLRLEDLAVALRTVDQSRELGGISCSIDPTEEGYRALRQVLNQQRKDRNVNPPVLEQSIKRAFGPQHVTISGVPATTRFARILIAADYRLKRLAMNLDPSPVLPSYIELIKQAGSSSATSTNPRWWLACNYEPLATSDDHLAWELRGPGVKAMTEDEVVNAKGQVRGTGRASGAAQKWANLVTEKYEEICKKDAVFGELRNLMDMCVIAALLEKEGLWDKAGLKAPGLRDPQNGWKLEVWNAPKIVPPEVSFVHATKAWIVTASGGVQLTPWQVASKVETSAQVADTRKKAQPTAKSLWWQ